MRSPRTFAGALILLLGVLAAFVAGAAFNGPAELVIHLALGASFFLIASSAFDFRLPTWLAFIALVAIGVLAAVFTLQGVSDLLHSDQLRHLAYEELGQRLEKVLGYAFLAWCLAVLVWASTGVTRIFGWAIFVIILGVEIYSFTITQGRAAAPEVLKLLYLPLFVWLLLEARKPRAAV